MKPRLTLLQREESAFLFLLAATAVAAAPLLPPGAIYASWDALFSAICVERLQWVLVEGGDWRVGPFAWPLKDSVAQADWMGAQAALGLPLRWLAVPVHRAYALLSTLGLLLTALACHRLARALLGPGPHTWIAGVGGGLSSALVAHGPHANLVHHELVVLGALGLGAGLWRDRPGLAAAGGAAMALSVHFGFYIGLHAAVTFSVVLLVLWRGRPALAALLGAAAGSLPALPVLRTYARAADTYGLWFTNRRAATGSWQVLESLWPSPAIPLHAPFARPLDVNEVIPQANPGYALLVLGAAGVVLVLRRGGERRPWGAALAVLVTSAALALGPEIRLGEVQTGWLGPHWLLNRLPGGQGFRAPARWLQVAFIANALFAAAAIQALSRRRPIFAVVAGLLVLAELPRVNPGGRTVADLAPEAIYAQVPPGLEPMAEIATVNNTRCSRFRSLTAAAEHHRPLVGGALARRFPALDEVNRSRGAWPARESAQFLAESGVAWVLEHPPVSRRAPEGWRCVELDRHRLCQREAP